MQHHITYSTDDDAVEDVLAAVAMSYGYADAEAALFEAVEDIEELEEEPPATAGHAYGWTPPKMRRYIGALQPTARKVLRALAEGAPSLSVDEAQTAAGLTAQEFGGAMSSFGFAARSVRGVRTKPFTKIESARTYEMSPAVAAIALEALEQLGF